MFHKFQVDSNCPSFTYISFLIFFEWKKGGRTPAISIFTAYYACMNIRDHALCPLHMWEWKKVYAPLPQKTNPIYTKNLHVTRTYILIVTVHFYIPNDPRDISGYQALHSILKSILVVNLLKITGSTIFLKHSKDKSILWQIKS